MEVFETSIPIPPLNCFQLSHPNVGESYRHLMLSMSQRNGKTRKRYKCPIKVERRIETWTKERHIFPKEMYDGGHSESEKLTGFKEVLLAEGFEHRKK